MKIYLIRNKINNKIYIGQYSSKKNDFDNYWGSGELIKRAIKKYGLDNFEKIILEVCKDKKKLDSREKYWISEYNSTDKNIGYNLCEGGTGGNMSKFIDYSDVWKQGQSKRTKEYWESLTEDEYNNRCKVQQGEKNGMFGKEGYWKDKQIPIEYVNKMIKTKETNGTLRQYNENNPNWRGGGTFCKCGIKINSNNSSCIKCLDKSGDKNPFYGKTHSDEVKNYLSELNKKRGYVGNQNIEFEIDGVRYKSLGEASKQLNIPTTTIRWRIKSKNKKYENYKYIE